MAKRQPGGGGRPGTAREARDVDEWEADSWEEEVEEDPYSDGEDDEDTDGDYGDDWEELPDGDFDEAGRRGRGVTRRARVGSRFGDGWDEDGDDRRRGSGQGRRAPRHRRPDKERRRRGDKGPTAPGVEAAPAGSRPGRPMLPPRFGPRR